MRDGTDLTPLGRGLRELHSLQEVLGKEFSRSLKFDLRSLLRVGEGGLRREPDRRVHCAFSEEQAQREVPRAPLVDALVNHWPDMPRVVRMALMTSSRS